MHSTPYLPGTRVLAAKATGLAWVTFAILTSPGASAQVQPINVPNHSFETPTPPPGFPATPQVDAWQKAPQPAGVPLPGGVTWDQLAGVFPNTAAGSADHIDNLDGQQAAYLLAIPGVALFQDLDARYEVGQAYGLTIGILGGGGIAEGSLFDLSLYYRRDDNTPVTLASAPVTFSSSVFPDANHLLEYSVSLPEVQPGDDWAGRNIGVQLLSAFGTGVGYWDVDNVRVASVPEPGAGILMLAGAAALGLTGRRTCRKRS